MRCCTPQPTNQPANQSTISPQRSCTGPMLVSNTFSGGCSLYSSSMWQVCSPATAPPARQSSSSCPLLQPAGLHAAARYCLRPGLLLPPLQPAPPAAVPRGCGCPAATATPAPRDPGSTSTSCMPRLPPLLPPPAATARLYCCCCSCCCSSTSISGSASCMHTATAPGLTWCCPACVVDEGAEDPTQEFLQHRSA